MSRPKKYSLADVLEAIQESTVYEIIAVPPTIKQIAERLGAGSTRTVHRYLGHLEKAGRIIRRQGKIVWQTREEQ